MSISIAHAAWLKTPETRAVVAALEDARAGSARFVGGCVRNTLMGLAIDDIDIATQLHPNEVIKAATKAGLAAHPTGVEHGTVTVVSNHVPFEITTLRRDVSTDGRHATVAFSEDWAEDAQRRDFRLNALYAAPDGEVFDPTQGGIEDARAGRIIFVGDPETRLKEDYLRILRFFRFNAWYGRGALDIDGLAACAKCRDGLAQLSVERIWKELKKLLSAPDPSRALEAMREVEIVRLAMPEATRFTRLLHLIALEHDMALTGEAMTRVAAALPDVDGARLLAQRLKLSNDERLRLVQALEDNERIVSYLSQRELRRVLYRIGAAALKDRVMLAWADAGGDKASQWRALLALADTWERPKFPLTGEEVMAAGVPAGPKVGAVMREVEAWWIDADFTDDKLSIVERLKAVAQGMG